MKKITLIFLTFIIFLFTTNLLNAQIYRHSVCVVPGHGGPGAGKYGTNGGGYNEGRGSAGPNGLTEEWVNLQVSFHLMYITNVYLAPELEHVLMSRTTDTEDVSLPRRAEMANFANCSDDPEVCSVDQLIVVHHNGLQLWEQGVETFWCIANSVNIGGHSYNRVNTQKLAEKVYYSLRDKFYYPPYSERNFKNNCSDYYMLFSTRMASVLSEATNIHNYEEEELFADENSGHAIDEGVAIYHGWWSYVTNGGIAKIENRWIGGDGQLVRVDEIVRNSPYITCWATGEYHWLEALTGEYFDGYLCYFHHWKKEETGEIWSNRILYVTIPPSESTHTYIAYFRGGPYYAELTLPVGGEEWLVGNSEFIYWPFTCLGVDYTTLVDVFLDRNGGNGGFPETLFTGIPRKEYAGASWEVTGPASKKCRIKIVAHDCVDNTATDVNTYDFTIRFPNIAGDADSDGEVSIADAVYLVNYLFKGGPAPEPSWKGDANGDCKVSIGDIVYLINYLTKGGPAPVCNGNCWACMRAVVKEDENPFVKDPSLAKKIYKQ